MAVIKFQKKEEPEILFGIKLPEIVKNLYYEIKNRDRFLAVLKETFNINEDRYLKIVNARDLKGNDTLIVVIFDNFYSKRNVARYDYEIEEFDFKIYEFDYNLEVNVEKIIEQNHIFSSYESDRKKKQEKARRHSFYE